MVGTLIVDNATGAEQMDIEAIRREFECLKRQVEAIEELLKAEDKVSISSEATQETVCGPFYGIDPAAVGLHRLKDKWRQKSYIKDHCEYLLKPNMLQNTIQKTKHLAPQRTAEQGFVIADEFRTPIDDITSGTERWMEAELFKLYDLTTRTPQLCSLWKGICARQVPLFDAAARAGWGEIDLLAVGNEGQPTVIELKLHKENGGEPPQRPLFEGAAYSVALTKCWSSFWPEWDSILGAINFDNGEAVNASQRVDVILLAPDSYWDHWKSQSQFKEAKKSYKQLVEQFADQNVSVKFAGIKLRDDGKPDEVHDRSDFVS